MTISFANSICSSSNNSPTIFTISSLDIGESLKTFIYFLQYFYNDVGNSDQSNGKKKHNLIIVIYIINLYFFQYFFTLFFITLFVTYVLMKSGITLEIKNPYILCFQWPWLANSNPNLYKPPVAHSIADIAPAPFS